MKIRVAIVEDCLEDKELLVKQLKRYEQKNGVLFEIKWFPYSAEFVESYEPNYDVVFMDIEMPGFNGIETARLLRKRDEKVALIFVTNLAQYAINGYEVNAYDFIVKPIQYENLSRKFDKFIGSIEGMTKQTISIKTKQGYVVINVDDILYVESNDHKVTYHLLGQNVSTFSSMKEVAKLLPSDSFVSCNQSYYVNMNYVEEINNYDLIVHGETLIISRPKKRALIDAFTAFMKGRL